jgi:hypothetical protein
MGAKVRDAQTVAPAGANVNRNGREMGRAAEGLFSLNL